MVSHISNPSGLVVAVCKKGNLNNGQCVMTKLGEKWKEMCQILNVLVYGHSKAIFVLSKVQSNAQNERMGN